MTLYNAAFVIIMISIITVVVVAMGIMLNVMPKKRCEYDG